MRLIVHFLSWRGREERARESISIFSAEGERGQQRGHDFQGRIKWARKSRQQYLLQQRSRTIRLIYCRPYLIYWHENRGSMLGHDFRNLLRLGEIHTGRTTSNINSGRVFRGRTFRTVQLGGTIYET